jgi:hypothetical protein
MRIFLAGWAMLAFVAGVFFLASNLTAAGLAFTVATIALGSAATVEQLLMLRKELRAQHP